MNNLLVTVTTGFVIDENAKVYFIQENGMTFMLDKAEGKHKVGDMVRGSAYTNVHQKARLTTADVTITRTTYDWGVVTEVHHDLGVFLDTGLADKQLIVSPDVLPDTKGLWSKRGNKLYAHLDVDKRDHIWAIPAQPEVSQKMAGSACNNMQNEKLYAIVYRLKLSGILVHFPDNNMLDFIHSGRCYVKPHLSEEVTVRVIGFREVDRTLSLSLKPCSFEMLENDSQMILTYLQSNDGLTTLDDRSSPADVKATSGIPKGRFKKALGGLMKA